MCAWNLQIGYARRMCGTPVETMTAGIGCEIAVADQTRIDVTQLPPQLTRLRNLSRVYKEIARDF